MNESNYKQQTLYVGICQAASSPFPHFSFFKHYWIII